MNTQLVVANLKLMSNERVYEMIDILSPLGKDFGFSVKTLDGCGGVKALLERTLLLE